MVNFNELLEVFFQSENDQKIQILQQYLKNKLISADLAETAEQEKEIQVEFERKLDVKSVSSSVTVAAPASQEIKFDLFSCLPDDYSTLLDFDPTKQPEGSIFYLDSTDPEKIFLMQLFYQIVQQASFEKIQNSGECILLYNLIFDLEKQKDLLFPTTLQDFLGEFKTYDGSPHKSYGVNASKQLHSLLRLLVVDPSIKFDREFKEFNIKAEYSLSERIRLDPFNKFMPSHYQTIGQKSIVKQQAIRGDGNCYYSSIAYDVLRRIILNPEDLEFSSNAYRQFVAAGEFIEKYYPSELERLQQSHHQMMQSLFDEDGKFKLKFIHDLDRLYLNDKEFYMPLIYTFRMLLANVIDTKRNHDFHGLTLECLIGPSQRMDTTTWINSNVLRLGECAEGAPIDLALLPKLFKCAQHLFTLDRAQPLSELLEPLENTSPIILCFSPGHYDLFNSYELQEKIETNRDQFYQLKTGGLYKPPVRTNLKNVVNSQSLDGKQQNLDTGNGQGTTPFTNLADDVDKNSETPSKTSLSIVLEMVQAGFMNALKCLANFVLFGVNICISLVNCIGFNFTQCDLYSFSAPSSFPC